MKTPFVQTVVALALATLSMQAIAHRPWLLPSTTFVENKDPWVTIDAAISEQLFELDHIPLKLDGAAVIGPDGAAGALPAITAGKLRNTFDLNMKQAGTYKVSLVTQSVMASYKEGGEIKRFRGTEETFAKEVPANAPELRATFQHARLETFVTANKATDGAFKPSGSGLELVPLTHPTEMRVGETAKWRFLLDGKPAANLPFSLVPGGVRYRGTINEIRLTTDVKGEAVVKVPMAGMFWVNAAFPAGLGKGQPVDGPAMLRRFSYAATVEVLPE
ncbi:MAG: DUF4198 domain-containing protein [Pseudomonadota bacterium]